MFSTDPSRDARCDLATLLVEHLDKATLAAREGSSKRSGGAEGFRGAGVGRTAWSATSRAGKGRVLHPPDVRVGRLESPPDETGGGQGTGICTFRASRSR